MALITSAGRTNEVNRDLVQRWETQFPALRLLLDETLEKDRGYEIPVSRCLELCGNDGRVLGKVLPKWKEAIIWLRGITIKYEPARKAYRFINVHEHLTERNERILKSAERKHVSCDTGCELPETYEYLDQIEALLGEPIKRINALDMFNIRQKPGRTPFDIWLKEAYGDFLPNPRARWCTSKLKIEPFEKFIGNNYAYSYIGIRADENREGYKGKKPPVFSQRPNIIPVYPLKENGIKLNVVSRILIEAGIGFPEYYKWRSRSGCYFCFYQQIGERQRLRENHKDLFDRACSYEKKVNGKKYTWVQGRSLSETATSARVPVSFRTRSATCRA